MALPWCEKCKNKCEDRKEINLKCLRCKWQYVGQSVFDRKADLFENDANDILHKTPYEYWKGFEMQMSSAEII